MISINENKNIKSLVYSKSSIFNYMKTEAFFTNVYSKKKFRFSNLELTNDPYEYKTVPSFSYPYSNEVEISKKELDSCNDVVKEINRIRKRLCIGCFCYNEDDTLTEYNLKTGYLYYAQKGFDHARMWSQYGEDHKGLCLVFDKNILLEEVQSICSEKDLLFDSNIQYKQNQIRFPDWEEIEPIRLKSSVETAIKYFLIQKNQQKLIFTKDIDYEREKEFRLAFYSENDYEYIGLSSLKTIIIGDRFPKHLECSIGEVGQSLNIPILKMNYSALSHELSIFYN